MQTFSPFPLRARGLVEQFDAAIKLFKQYFWVLLGWSAITTTASFLGAVLPMGGLAGLFMAPINIGASICCVAAAVRGQSVEFGQCWRFTQPRFWPILGLYFLSLMIATLVLMALAVIITLIVVAGITAFRNSTGAAQLFMGIVGFVVLGVIVTIVATVVLSWTGLVSVVVCMEDDKRNTAALGRAFDLLRGHWVRITTLMALVGMAFVALYAILLGTAALLTGVNHIRDLATGKGWDSASLIPMLIAFVGSTTLLSIVYTPLYYLIITVFYLDVRVRQEALDLEWTAHTTAPVVAATSTPAVVRSPYESTPYESTLQPASESIEGALPRTEYSAPAYGTQRLDVSQSVTEAPPTVQSEYLPRPENSPFATSTHTAPPNAPSTPAPPSDAALDLEPRASDEQSDSSAALQTEQPSQTENTPRPQW
jgi:hypothetical protein